MRIARFAASQSATDNVRELLVAHMVERDPSLRSDVVSFLQTQDLHLSHSSATCAVCKLFAFGVVP